MDGNTEGHTSISSDTAVSAPEKAKKKWINKKTIIILFSVLGVLLLVLAVLIIVIIINQPKEEDVKEEETSLASEAGEEFKSFDLKNPEVKYYQVEQSVTKMINSAGIYKGCTDYDKETKTSTIDSRCVVDNLEKVVADNDITDKNQLLIVELEKAKIYTVATDYTSAWTILEKINEKDLLENQVHLYYETMYRYYYARKDSKKYEPYAEKLWKMSEDFE